VNSDPFVIKIFFFAQNLAKYSFPRYSRGLRYVPE
jgi:hypothetical protein